MIYWVWEIISPSRWFLLIEILLSVSNLSIRAGGSGTSLGGGSSREGQFPVFETSSDHNINFIRKTTFIFRTITKNVPYYLSRLWRIACALISIRLSYCSPVFARLPKKDHEYSAAHSEAKLLNKMNNKEHICPVLAPSIVQNWFHNILL